MSARERADIAAQVDDGNDAARESWVEEKWARIPFAPDYEVSTHGRVRSWLESPYHAPAPRMLKPTQQPDGYQTVGLYVDGQQTTHRIHRLVAEAFLGPRPASFHTRHLNGDASDNRLENLAYGTQSENERDKKLATHCKAGHLLEGDNVYVRSRGRRCVTCVRAYRARMWAEFKR